MLCFVGQEDCGPGIYLLAWAVVFSNMLAYLSLAYLLRYSEGSNYMIVAMVRNPIYFISYLYSVKKQLEYLNLAY